MGARLKKLDASHLFPKILIVDDENVLRAQLAFRFTMEGFTVIEASTGNEAKCLLEREHPEMVLTDIRMSDGDGAELIDWTRQQISSEDAPTFICMSGYSDLAAKDAYSKNVSAFFLKPFDLDEMVAAVKHFAADHMLRSALREKAAFSDQERKILQMPATILTHEIANPLQLIQFALYQIQEIANSDEGAGINPATKKRVSKALVSSKLIARTLEGIRMLYRNKIESQRKSQINVANLIRKVSAEIEQNSAEDGGKSEFNASTQDGIQEIVVHEEALEIILCNLMRNALNAHGRDKPGRNIDITVGSGVSLLKGDENQMVEIRVMSYGRGIDAAIIPRLFELGTTSSQTTGMGIGLAVSRLLAEKLGGALTLEKVADPTVFLLQLP